MTKVDILAPKGQLTQTRIMVVDDEPSMCEFLRIMLLKEGYAVETRTSPRQALSELEKSSQQPGQNFNLVITDLKMPGMSGLEVLEKLNKMDDRPEVVMISGHGGTKYVVDSMRLGAAEFIDKPSQFFLRFDRKHTCKVTVDDIVEALMPKSTVREPPPAGEFSPILISYVVGPLKDPIQ